MKPAIIFSTVCLFFALGLNLNAQDNRASLDAETLKKANNPMAHVKAFNVQNYIVSSLYGTDATANQLMLRYAQPVGKFLLRGTMPFVVSSMPDTDPVTGFGDFNMFGIYSVTKNGNQFGVGPTVTAPTGTHNLGQGKWQAGLSALAFMASDPVMQYGALLQWQASFAGDEDRADVSLLTSQVFFMWQVGGGLYLRSTGIWTFDLTNGHYAVPIGLGLGKVVKVNKVVFNIFAEPQFSVLAQGTGQSKFQTFIGFNTQF